MYCTFDYYIYIYLISLAWKISKRSYRNLKMLNKLYDDIFGKYMTFQKVKFDIQLSNISSGFKYYYIIFAFPGHYSIFLKGKW